jgi:rhomboid protease GluP
MDGSSQPASGDEFAYTRIAAQSRRQAMDWSLVLASQDIHPIIQGPEEPNGEPLMEQGPPRPTWSLLVEPAQYERAVATIRQYRLENRGWAWRKELPGAAVEIHTGAIFWCVLLIASHWVVTFIAPNWNTRAEMSSVEVSAGEWYRLFTPILLHADLAHLMANATFGAIFLGLAMARFGWGVTLLATFLAGGAGNLLGYFVYEGPYRGRGASGMMMGALGLLCIQSFGLWRKSPKAARYILSGVLAGFLLFVLFGLDPGSDVLAHFGGFAAGLLFGAILSIIPEAKLQTKTANMAALAVVTAIIAVTWALALR